MQCIHFKGFKHDSPFCLELQHSVPLKVNIAPSSLTGPSRFTFVPVVRNSGADSQDVLLLDQEWSFEGPVTTFSRRRHARHHYHPVSTRPIPTTYPPSRSASDLKKRSHHAFRVYVIHSHDPDLPFNQELKALEDGPRITAEFIVVEHSEGGRRITNAKPADKSDMDRVVVSSSHGWLPILTLQLKWDS
ncbi:hypothetical protein OH76DRAFT_1422428 [Lentinus brumalis]|uniref:Uncharacterized protein n=1 Tax=Lentinus brumalis TaxID=2498619 RepID=A0A371CQM0_9APHY|nr:hypothetical protein OH76DRAFT_1422428 [Polyporus brumalis]